jgi:hypothetical protein
MQKQQALNLATGTRVIVTIKGNGRALNRKMFGVVQATYTTQKNNVWLTVAVTTYGYSVNVPYNQVRLA